MNLIRSFQKIKWEILAKFNPSYYVFSDEIISKDEIKYRKSGKDDFQKFILKDKELKRFLESSQSKTCLEFGCGNGRMTEFFAENFNLVLAIDISSEMVKLAKKRLNRFNNVKYLVDNGKKIDVSNNSVDFIFSYAVL